MIQTSSYENIVNMYVCMYVCMYVYIYIYIYFFFFHLIFCNAYVNIVEYMGLEIWIDVLAPKWHC